MHRRNISPHPTQSVLNSPTALTSRRQRPSHIQHPVHEKCQASPPFTSYITPECIHVISQSSPHIPPLRSDGSILLAQRAEFYIRHIIHLAKAHMLHSNSHVLSANHIQLALNPPNTSQFVHCLGHLSSERVPSFQPVTTCSGLYVATDSIISLRSLLNKTVLMQDSEPRLLSSKLFVPRNTIEPVYHTSTQISVDPMISQILSSLSSSGSSSRIPPEYPLRSFILSPTIPLQPLISILQDAVRDNACRDGQTKILLWVMRITLALTTSPFHTIDLFEESILSVILTCLLGPNLGKDDAFVLREIATEVLFSFLCQTSNHYSVQQRVKNTLYAVLVHRYSTLETIFGAIMGFSVMGPSAFRTSFFHHMSMLITALYNALDSSSALPLCNDTANSLHQNVTRLANGIERAMRVTSHVDPDTAVIDVIL